MNGLCIHPDISLTFRTLFSIFTPTIFDREKKSSMDNKGVRVLIVDDEESYRATLAASLRSEGFAVDPAEDGVQGINAVQAKPYDIVLLDVKMPNVDGLEVLRFVKENFPDVEVIMLTAVVDVRIAVECMKLGAYDYLTKPFPSGELLGILERTLEHKRLLRENLLLKSALSRLSGSSEMIGKSKALHKVLEMATKVAATDSTVLIQGPSGTGKELIAIFIHQNSERKDRSFVTLNCASIPDSLIESELFGHEKGAFTDARTAKPGLVEVAGGGTLFLDEVGDVSATIQPKLLRFVQTGEFRRVGGTTTLKTDVRIISATNKNLAEEVRAGQFREDLLYRLNVITIELPPLKDRMEDVPLLVGNFLKNKLHTKVPKNISPRAMEILMKYDWPGNIRELENVVERAAILCKDDMIQPDDISLPLRATGIVHEFVEHAGIGGTVSMKDIERRHIDGVLRALKGNKTEAAKVLGMSLKTLYTKIHRYQIKSN